MTFSTTELFVLIWVAITGYFFAIWVVIANSKLVREIEHLKSESESRRIALNRISLRNTELEKAVGDIGKISKSVIVKIDNNGKL